MIWPTDVKQPSNRPLEYHALAKADLLGYPRGDVEQVLLDCHRRRMRNSGTADWLTGSRTARHRLQPPGRW
jgi:hypothetical protein